MHTGCLVPNVGGIIRFLSEEVLIKNGKNPLYGVTHFCRQ